MLDLRRLRVLQEVARHGSLSHAARALNYTQPAISHHIRRLEEETGTALITRLGRGVRLTEAGTALVEHVDGILARMTAAEEEVAAIAGLHAGRVRVVSFPGASLTLMSGALARLKERHASIEVSVVTGRPPESLARLRAGECDLVVSFDYPGAPADQIAGLVKVPLLDGRLHAVLASGHPLQGEGALRLAALSHETWLAGCARCQRGLIDACARAGFTPETTLGIPDLTAIQGMVAEGMGIALVPALVLDAYRHPGVVVRPLVDAPTWEISAVVHDDGPPAAAMAMLDALRTAAGELRERASDPDGDRSRLARSPSRGVVAPVA